MSLQKSANLVNLFVYVFAAVWFVGVLGSYCCDWVRTWWHKRKGLDRIGSS